MEIQRPDSKQPDSSMATSVVLIKPKNTNSTFCEDFDLKDSGITFKETPTSNNVYLSIVSTWETFQSVTTSHGLPHFDRTKGGKFLNYSVNVAVQLKRSSIMKFPAVTICNNNPILKTEFDNMKSMVKILKSLDDKMKISICIETNPEFHPPTPARPIYYGSLNDSLIDSTFDSASRSTVEQTTTATLSPLPDCKQYNGVTNDGRQQRSDFILFNKLIEEYSLLTDEQKKIGGHTLEYLDFKHFFNNYHGNCYTFNYGVNLAENSTLKVSKKAGPRYGLSILFYANQFEYIGQISQSAGLRVIVHDSMRMPFPEDDAILVGPQTLTHIAVTVTKTKKLNGLYGNCRSEDDHDSSPTLYQTLYNVSYCQKGCLYTCLNEEILQKCGCYDLKFPLTKNVRSSTSPCSFNNETMRKHFTREIIYNPVISRELWPSDNFLTVMASIPRYEVHAQDINIMGNRDYGHFRQVGKQQFSGFHTCEAEYYSENFLLKTSLSSLPTLLNQQNNNLSFVNCLFGAFAILKKLFVVEAFAYYHTMGYNQTHAVIQYTYMTTFLYWFLESQQIKSANKNKQQTLVTNTTFFYFEAVDKCKSFKIKSVVHISNMMKMPYSETKEPSSEEVRSVVIDVPESTNNTFHDDFKFKDARSTLKETPASNNVNLSIISTWEAFQSVTTSHGLPHFSRAKGPFKKTLWLLVTLAGLGGLIFNAYLLCSYSLLSSSKFLNYEVNVAVQLNHANTMTFPAVTICNNNPILKHFFDKFQPLKETLTSFNDRVRSTTCDEVDPLTPVDDPPTTPIFDFGSSAPGNTRFTTLNPTIFTTATRDVVNHTVNQITVPDTTATPSDWLLFNNKLDCNQYDGITDDGRQQRSDYKLFNQVMEEISKQNASTKKQSGYDLDSILVNCFFAGGNCNQD
ncbi:hypothetical protein HELRODRAFT_168368 [Helobdella robusta]|uniref:Uncharacterized protein n=1 Tax=Helobdella robusta TaxID=6412 RepID=T1F0H6_HELRO|nr:hypothetical protein HELRODRAFT_168368 [Helobdella robusta]ESO09387.1 hypothetical protein HELRODRAFT_168368 [Helobdella robusta]